MTDPATIAMEQQLAALAAGLCHDAGIRLQVRGDRWYYDPWRRILNVSESSLQGLGEDWCAGRLVNEVGHYWLTRHDLFHIDFPSIQVARSVLDGLEDARVDGWMMKRYPGARAWLGRVYATQNRPSAKQLPLVLLFAREASCEPGRNWLPAHYPLPDPVVQALEVTREARREYAECVPSTRMGHVEIQDITRVYVEEVSPRLARPMFLPARYEAEIRLRALEALEIAEDEIFPVAEQLFEMDMEAVAEWLAENPEEARNAQDGEPCEGAPWGEMPGGQGAPDYMRQLAQQLLESESRESSEQTERLCEGAGPPRPMQGQPRQRRPGGWGPGSSLEVRPPTLSDYQAARMRMSSQIDRLVTHLERVLVPRQRLRSRSGYPSGRHVDMRALMAFDADPRWYNKLWTRSTVPERRRVAFSLLVDLSGSMDGEKANTAFLGTVLMVETLNRLEVPFAVNGFQAHVLPFANFHEPFGKDLQNKIATMPSRTNNANDDGPCLMQVSEVLLNQPVDDRFMVVVSDGQPSERTESEADLRRAITTLNSPEVPLHLFGIGLGPDTEHVADYYPESRASVPVAEFADVIGGLIARGLNVE